MEALLTIGFFGLYIFTGAGMKILKTDNPVLVLVGLPYVGFLCYLAAYAFIKSVTFLLFHV